MEHTAPGGWHPALRSRQSTADPCRRAGACREGIGGANRVAGGSRFSCDTVNSPVACRNAVLCRSTKQLLNLEGHCAAARTADDDSADRRARMRAGVRLWDSTRAWLPGECVHVRRSQRGLGRASHEERWMRMRTQLHAMAAARGGQDKRCSRRRAERVGGQETVQKDSLWVSAEVGFVNTGLRFHAIGPSQIDAALSTATQPCTGFMLTALDSCCAPQC